MKLKQGFTSELSRKFFEMLVFGYKDSHLRILKWFWPYVVEENAPSSVARSYLNKVTSLSLPQALTF